MVITITINPLLERRVYYDNVNLGAVNRGIREEYKTGGKGINVSRQLVRLGIKNSAYTFAGGNSGKIFRHILKEENIDGIFIQTKADTRSALVAVEEDKKRVSTFAGPEQELKESEIKEFKNKLPKIINNSSTVVLAGSSPGGKADEIFPYAIEVAKEMDKTVILDTYGSHLAACLDKGPDIVHNNVTEITNSLGVELKTEKEKFGFLAELYNKGVKLAFVTDGPGKIYASKFDFLYSIEPPVVEETDQTGSGDAFTAGIAFGIEKALVFDEFTAMAAALGAANASVWDVCNVDPEEYRELTGKVKITPVGKKMKLIDDSPSY